MTHATGVGFFVGAGIPKGPRVNKFVECGCCGAYHRADFNGDCREDSERHYDLPDDAVIVDEEEKPTYDYHIADNAEIPVVYLTDEDGEVLGTFPIGSEDLVIRIVGLLNQ